MKKLDLNVFECSDPNSVYRPPQDHIAVSHDSLGNMEVYKSDGLKYIKIDLNQPVKVSSKEYSLTSSQTKHLSVSTDGEPTTLVLHNKEGVTL